jgi:hypothetical protein
MGCARGGRARVGAGRALPGSSPAPLGPGSKWRLRLDWSASARVPWLDQRTRAPLRARFSQSPAARNPAAHGGAVSGAAAGLAAGSGRAHGPPGGRALTRGSYEYKPPVEVTIYLCKKRTANGPRSIAATLRWPRTTRRPDQYGEAAQAVGIAAARSDHAANLAAFLSAQAHQKSTDEPLTPEMFCAPPEQAGK